MPVLTVIHIAPTPFFSDRGCHIRIRNEIYSLQRQAIRIILCTYHHGGEVEGIEIRRIPRIPGYSKRDAGYSPFKFLADVFLFFLVAGTVWRERPSLLHAHLHEGALIGWAVKVLFFWRHLPLIMDMQGSLSGELAAYGVFRSVPVLLNMFRLAEYCICRLPDFCFSSSEAGCKLLAETFRVRREKIQLLQDVVPDDFFTDLDREHCRNKFDIPPHKKIILYTGSLLEGKGIGYVRESMRTLSRQRDDLFWLLVGYPLDATRNYIQEHKLEHICLLPGQVAYSELPLWLATADLALEPKNDEAGEASGKVLHYMAAGLPIVCFPTGNNRDVLATTGFFAESVTGEAFTAAIVQALDRQVEAGERGRANREIARNRFSMAAVEQKLMALYRRLAIEGR